MANIAVLYSEYVGELNWGPLSGGYTVTKIFSAIPGASFVTGHRYLLICKAHVANYWAPTRTWAEVHQGGVAIPKLGSGNYYSSDKGLNRSNRPHDGFAIITGDSTKDVEYIGRWTGTGGTYYSQMADTQMLAIDLDTVGATLIENTDWFHTENATNHAPGGTVYVSTEAASLTFTPDGVSDYLVLGDIKFGGVVTGSGVRLYDVTGAATLGVAGAGGYALPKSMLMSVLEAPPATPRTIRTDYYTSASTKINAQVFVLRLNSFKSYGFSQRDLGGIAPTTPNVYQDATLPISYTPDDVGDVVLLASARGYLPVNTEDGYGLNGRILYDGVPLTAHTGDAKISQGAGAPSNPAFNRVGDTFAMRLTGKSGAVDVKTEIRADNAWAAPANMYFYDQTLIAFGTELLPNYLDSVDPATGAFSKPGDILTINGTFDTATSYQVYVGPNGDATDPLAHAGPGLGSTVTSLDGLTLVVYLPELPAGVMSHVFVAETGEPSNSVALLDVLRGEAPPYNSAIWGMKSLFSPNRALGTRNMAQLAEVSQPGNQLLQTESAWAVAPWVTVNADANNGEDDARGTAKGLTLDEDGTASALHHIYQSVVVSVANVYTLSVYARAFDRRYVYLGLSGSGYLFDLQEGLRGDAIPTNNAPIDGTIVPGDPLGLAGDVGWWRISVTVRPIVDGAQDFTLAIASTFDEAGLTFTGLSQNSLQFSFPCMDIWPVPRLYRATTTEVLP